MISLRLGRVGWIRWPSIPTPRRGRPTVVDLAGGASRSWSYTDGQLSGFEQSGVGDGFDVGLGYDSVGRLVDVDSGEHTYSYDKNDQLAEEVHGSGSISYGYDGNGRRVSREAGSPEQVYWVFGCGCRYAGLSELDYRRFIRTTPGAIRSCATLLFEAAAETEGKPRIPFDGN